MDPSKKKWLIRLSENIADNFKNNPQTLKVLDSFDQDDGMLTSNLLNATGLIFGHTDQHLFCDFDEVGWSISDHIKIGITECLIAIFLKHKSVSKKTVNTDIEKALESIYQFYEIYSPSKLKNSIFDFGIGKGKTLEDKLEEIINNRLSNSSILQKKFWKGSIFNTFIYLDLLYYSHWIEKNEIESLPSLEDIKVAILETIIAATWCEGTINKENKILLYYFLSSAILSQEKQNDIERHAINGLSIDELQYPRLPLIFKEIILKSALLSTLNDKQLSSKEEIFLNKLITKLQVSKQTLEQSIIQTQSFVLSYFDKVTFLKNKRGYEIISKGFITNFSSNLKKNKNNIIKEISESKELVELLWKAKNKHLTPEEKIKVKEQITDILRTLPSFAIFMIPGGSVLLPLILKILPDELLIPSSFRN